MASWRRNWRVVVIGVLVVLLAGPVAVARAKYRHETEPVGRTVQQVQWGTGTGCRRLLGLPEECSVIDGRLVSEAQMAEYEGSWVHRAHALQRALDESAPLTESLFVHTHNSFNAAAYSPTVSGLDPNQIYSLRDQLRMDARAIEIDVHWVLNEPIMCHGEAVALGVAVVHAGCTIERHLKHGLAEVRAWLDEPANRNEFVLLYLENVLDDDPAAHAAATAAIQQHLGDLVARPPAGAPCAPIPLAATRAQMLDAGHRVLIVGNCGPGAWGTWVHERATGENWLEGSSGMGDDYPNYPACESRRSSQGYGERLIRHWEDSTWLSTVAGAGGTLSAVEARRMARCGVNLIGFDQLHPDDPRLASLIWSWATNEPSTAGPACALQGGDARFRSGGCGGARRYACVDASGWHVTTTAGSWGGGATACASEFPGSTFSVPANGYRNEKLSEARSAAGASTVWLAYADTGSGWSVTTS